MKRFASLALVYFVVPLALHVGLFAADQGTPAEAKAMLSKATAHYRMVGRKQALADFTAKRPPFYDRDLYVFCIGPERLVSANGGFPETIGVPEDTAVDVDGKGLGATARQVTSANGEGFVRYRWINPASHNLEPKITFFAKVGDDVCGVGTYGPSFQNH